MEAMTISDLISPDGFYSLGCILSREEVVSAIISKFGTPPRHISTEMATSLVVSNTTKTTPPEKERVEFTEAGIRFRFIGEWLDVKTLPSITAVELLEEMKETRSSGYSYVKRQFVNGNNG